MRIEKRENDITNIFDRKGKLIYRKNGDNEFWIEYAEGGYQKYKRGKYYECLEEYDSRNKIICFKDLQNGFEEWYEYNEYGDLIHEKDSDGYEAWFKYEGFDVYKKDNRDCTEWTLDS